MMRSPERVTAAPAVDHKPVTRWHPSVPQHARVHDRSSIDDLVSANRYATRL
jgi:hypothetical protein